MSIFKGINAYLSPCNTFITFGESAPCSCIECEYTWCGRINILNVIWSHIKHVTIYKLYFEIAILKRVLNFILKFRRITCILISEGTSFVNLYTFNTRFFKHKLLSHITYYQKLKLCTNLIFIL